jgi:hypothetical protein
MRKTRRDHDVSGDREAERGTGRPTVDQHQKRLGHPHRPGHRHVQVARQFAQESRCPIARFVEIGYVSAAAKQLPRAGQYHATDRRIMVAAKRALKQRPGHRKVDGVARADDWASALPPIFYRDKYVSSIIDISP